MLLMLPHVHLHPVNKQYKPNKSQAPSPLPADSGLILLLGVFILGKKKNFMEQKNDDKKSHVTTSVS